MNRAIDALGGEGVQPISVSTDTNFLKAQISSGQHSTSTNDVMREAISRGDPREMAAVATAVKSIEEDQRKAAARASEVAAGQVRTTQSQLERAARKKLGVSTAADVLNRAIPRPMFF